MRELLEEHLDRLLVPVTVLPEVTYLLRSRLGKEAEGVFVASLANGEMEAEELRPEDLKRCVELMTKYPDIGFVDSTVVAIAERLSLSTIVTTDRRHFGAIRPRHCSFFELLPSETP